MVMVVNCTVYMYLHLHTSEETVAVILTVLMLRSLVDWVLEVIVWSTKLTGDNCDTYGR